MSERKTFLILFAFLYINNIIDLNFPFIYYAADMLFFLKTSKYSSGGKNKESHQLIDVDLKQTYTHI